jgi:hypothetical protein
MYRIQLDQDFEYGNSDLGSPVDGSEHVTSEIKSIDRDQANAELEKHEIVFDPKKLTMHKVIGPWHSEGGVPVNLNEGSFIFSNYKDLAINKKERELFELKMGGTYKAKNNTPAKILMKQIDIPHHNKMVGILTSSKYDDIAKNSAFLMVKKNLDQAGKVAYLQEKKKGFENGIPEFAQNTAPVYDTFTNNQISQSQQYMKRGGSYLQQYQGGISSFPKFKVNPATGLPELTSSNLFEIPTMGNNDYTSTTKQNNLFQTGLFGEYSANTKYNNTYPAQSNSSTTNTTPLTKTTSGVHPNETVVNNQQYPGSNVPLTGYQALNALYPLMQNVRTQRPMMMNVPQPVVAEPEYYSGQPQLDNIDQDLSLTRRMLRNINPAQALSSAQSMYGQGLDARSKVLGTIYDQNRQVRNQYNQGLAAAMNQRNMGQAQANQQYYRESQLADYNRYAMKQALSNKSFDTFNKYISDNQTLNNTLNAMNAGYRKDGQDPYILKPGFFGYSTVFNPKYKGNIFEIQTGKNNDKFEPLLKSLNEALASKDAPLAGAIANSLRALSTMYGQKD